MFMLAVASLLSVACGFQIKTIALSTDKVGQGENMTVTTTYASIDGNYTADKYYNLFAVRVPADWTAPKLTVTDTENDVDVPMTACPAYATLAEYCFPRDGYKWIGFQSAELYQFGNTIESVVELVAGQAMGDYTLDIVVGGWKRDPATQLLTANGQINFEEVFGWNHDKSDFSMDDQKTYFKSSEYLFIAGTFTAEEYNASKARLASKTITLPDPKNGNTATTRPISVDVANILSAADLDQTKHLAVEVVEGGAGVNTVAADAAEVVVKAGEGEVEVIADGGVATVYNAAGVQTDSKAVNGTATLRAHKGTALVQVVNGGNKIVKKVVVK